MSLLFTVTMSGKSITTIKLNGTNYLVWSKFVKVVLRAKKFEDFARRTPRSTLADYEAWTSVDVTVMKWLWH